MNKAAWKYYIRLYKGNYPSLLLSVLISICQSLIVLPMVWLVRHIIDVVIPSGDYQRLIWIGGILFMLILIGAGATLWTKRINLNVIKGVIQRLREEQLLKLYNLSRSYYSNADRSKLHTIIVWDTHRVEEMSTIIISQLLPALVITSVLSVVLVTLNWVLFLVMVAIAPVLIYISRKMGKKVKNKVKAFRRSLEVLSKDVWFALWMADLTILQTAEKTEIERQNQNFDDFRNIGTSVAWIQTIFNVINNTIVGFSGIVFLIIGGIAIGTNAMTIGSFFSFCVVASLLRKYMGPVLAGAPSIIAGNESLSELHDLLEMKDINPYAGTKKIKFEGNISLSSVSFKYEKKQVLQDISIEFKPNTMTAIIGPNGSGKSTIVNLVLGFYRPQEGLLIADGIPYNDLDLVDLRKCFGVVPQSIMLLPGTIWDNITYGCPDATRNEVYKIAEITGSHQFISKLSDGYETIVGDNGLKLSGGERQRIALVRALLRKPKLLILDEPTNHLDKSSTCKLMENLKTLDNFPSTLIISHNMDIVNEAQFVYVIEDCQLRLNKMDEGIVIPKLLDGFQQS